MHRYLNRLSNRSGITTIALACAGLVLTGCQSFVIPSSYAWMDSNPQKAEIWLNECEGNNNDMLRKEAYCSLAIKSKDVFDLDRSFAYHSRGQIHYRNASSLTADDSYTLARLQDAVGDYTSALRLTPDNPLIFESRGDAFLALGDAYSARADFRAVERLTGDTSLLEYADWWETERERLWREREAKRRWAVSFEGIWCGSVQGDSIFNQENEIRVQTFVYGSGIQPSSTEKPTRDSTFWGATAGYKSSRGEGDIWIGPAGVIDLSVVMWEHDNGGPMIDLATFAAVEIAFAYAGARSGGTTGGYSPGGAGAPTGASDLARAIVGDLIDDVVSDILKDIFGTHNDHMGTHHWTDLDVRDWAESQTTTEYGFTHHIATIHTQYGANCKTYYRFREL